MKYRFEYVLKPVVEFMRKDAEIAIDIDGAKAQFVISKGHPTVDDAQATAEAFCTELGIKIGNLILAETRGLKKAQP